MVAIPLLLRLQAPISHCLLPPNAISIAPTIEVIVCFVARRWLPRLPPNQVSLCSRTKPILAFLPLPSLTRTELYQFPNQIKRQSSWLRPSLQWSRRRTSLSQCLLPPQVSLLIRLSPTLRQISFPTLRQTSFPTLRQISSELHIRSGSS